MLRALAAPFDDERLDDVDLVDEENTSVSVGRVCFFRLALANNLAIRLLVFPEESAQRRYLDRDAFPFVHAGSNTETRKRMLATRTQDVRGVVGADLFCTNVENCPTWVLVRASLRCENVVVDALFGTSNDSPREESLDVLLEATDVVLEWFDSSDLCVPRVGPINRLGDT